MKAVIEIVTEVGRTRQAYERLKNIEGVKEVYMVTGHCDIIACVEAPDFKALSELILSKVHDVKGIVSTETLVCVE